jgi:hypothetical protein
LFAQAVAVVVVQLQVQSAVVAVVADTSNLHHKEFCFSPIR